jgi:hypothetical protein
MFSACLAFRLSPGRQHASESVLPADLCYPVLRRAPFTAAGWLFELKHDGFTGRSRAPAPRPS